MPRLQVGRIARRSWVGGLVLVAAVGLAQPTGVQAETPHASANACSSTPGIKPLIRGLVDRGPENGGVVPPAAGLQASSINVDWSTMEPNPGVLIDPSLDPILLAADAPGCTPIRIRILSGFDATPSWILDTLGSVNVINPYSQTQGTAGLFWTPDVEQDYETFEQMLAVRYESIPNIVEFVVSECALFYPEPFILGTSESLNDTNLVKAGYSESADQTCLRREIDQAADDWQTTRIGVSFNPYQTLNFASNSKGYTAGVDEAYTQQMMAYCRYTLGQRCVLENDSIRDPISSVGGSQPYYNEMYAAMTGASGPVDLTLYGLNTEVPLGAPIAFQTATDGTGHNIGDFWGTLEWARQQHAASVELPLDTTYPTTGGSGAPAWQTLAEVSQWFQDTPSFTGTSVTATQGTSTTGDAVGTLSLSELAAYDTQVPYGDVGSVPFDGVASAVIMWPNGVVQPGLVALGTGTTPTPSVTCGAAATCTVTVFSGGYTFPELPASGTGSVAITLSNNGAAYTPADGVAVAGTFPVTVVPAALTLKTFTVTPAKSAPTANLAATFADADPLGVAADYTVKVTWGDGTSSILVVKAITRGFSVSATHRYKRAGKDTVIITIMDTGGATVSGSRPITVR